MTRCDPADPTGWPDKTRSKTRLQPVDFCFCFFTKMTLFWIFLKIGIDPADPVTRSKPGTRAFDRAGFKNYDANYYSYCRWFFFVQIN